MTEEEATPQKNNLPDDPTISQVFEFIDISGGAVQVMPVTIDQSPLDTRLAIFIRGEHETASTIMAKLLSDVQDLFDMQEQHRAAAEKSSDIILN